PTSLDWPLACCQSSPNLLQEVNRLRERDGASCGTLSVLLVECAGLSTDEEADNVTVSLGSSEPEDSPEDVVCSVPEASRFRLRTFDCPDAGVERRVELIGELSGVEPVHPLDNVRREVGARSVLDRTVDDLVELAPLTIEGCHLLTLHSLEQIINLARLDVVAGVQANRGGSNYGRLHAASVASTGIVALLQEFSLVLTGGDDRLRSQRYDTCLL